MARPLIPEREHAHRRRAAADVVDARSSAASASPCTAWAAGAGPAPSLGVALVRLGHDPDAVVDYLHRVAVGRGRRGWPESPWQADTVRAAREPLSRLQE